MPQGICCILLVLLDVLSGNFQIVSGHQGVELAVLLVTGDLLLGTVGTNLGEVKLLQLVAFLNLNSCGDLSAVMFLFACGGVLLAKKPNTRGEY